MGHPLVPGQMLVGYRKCLPCGGHRTVACRHPDHDGDEWASTWFFPNPGPECEIRDAPRMMAPDHHLTD